MDILASHHGSTSPAMTWNFDFYDIVRIAAKGKGAKGDKYKGGDKGLQF